ncbi:MAG TPA: GNAT family N-acetyltransferase [Longimicrobium sp.]|jgi:RimJ/RimL family protein N-acetyltransferase
MDTTTGALSLRPIRDQDMDFLLRLYGTIRADELERVPWTPEQKEAFVRQQFTAQHAWWTEHYPDASFDLVLLDGEPIGRLYVDRWEREIRIVDIALLPEHRGAGIGTRLLRRVFAEGDAAGKPVSIHVEVFNPARRLYERLGFEYRGETGVYLLMTRPAAGAAAG